jgi:hypothetical protein
MDESIIKDKEDWEDSYSNVGAKNFTFYRLRDPRLVVSHYCKSRLSSRQDCGLKYDIKF